MSVTATIKDIGTELGAKVKSRARGANYEPLAFQAIAQEELEMLNWQLEFRPSTVAKFIRETSVPQGRHWFSDIPLVLYKDTSFSIELLCWMSATTAIHSHSFYGAFKVMQGSSLHSRYHFSPRRWVSERLALGCLQPISSEYLQSGDVRGILGGKDGLLHSLYHLESPSLTIVVRTPTIVSAKPQLQIYPPGLALDSPSLGADEVILHLRRFFSVLFNEGGFGAEKLFLETAATLDSTRMVQLCLVFSRRFSSDAARCNLIEVLKENHEKDVVECLDVALKLEQIEYQLKVARNSISDPELRLFMALLLNLRDRKSIFSMIRARYPDREAVDVCCDWLIKLSRKRYGAEAFMQEVASKAGEPGYRLGARIDNSLQRIDGVQQLRTWLGETDKEYGAPNHSDNPLERIPELAPLFTRNDLTDRSS